MTGEYMNESILTTRRPAGDVTHYLDQTGTRKNITLLMLLSEWVN